MWRRLIAAAAERCDSPKTIGVTCTWEVVGLMASQEGSAASIAGAEPEPIIETMGAAPLLP